ncbi:hypothetical protein TREMEDRAFT_58030 [Tremella mesenterica DSM 1558]|uniref:uncharacterized protein n=1 Tax=Tremella mesenterica (strain ATCC 24925 / CBS 8224 / DSM 1558 / NBRC 9311 / NRRL Y-6157 / RJB 2259-6 / UBC 559-6) TaxID=578456 RepID=UPI0003F49942|nr:uncharacterized protein TREMEDRAFT_58030 [Tremella mesenterica DSM 1558]EIW71899.1 hypothetical protein TREMEDRAFT_58030 [Tremella mesenterica DSM 1558]
MSNTASEVHSSATPSTEDLVFNTEKPLNHLTTNEGSGSDKTHTFPVHNHDKDQNSSNSGSTCGPPEEGLCDWCVVGQGTVHDPEPDTVSMSEQNSGLVPPESHAAQTPLKSSGINFESPSLDTLPPRA